MKIVVLLLVVTLLVLGVIHTSAMAKGRVNRTPVEVLDLDRYMGFWYEIARYDHRFERGLSCVRTCYTRHPDGRVSVENRGVDERTGLEKRAQGKARPSRLPGVLRVSFFWFFYSDYIVLELGDDYDWALVGGGSPKYLWILSRTPTLPAATLNHILSLAAQRGYDTARLLYVDQRE